MHNDHISNILYCNHPHTFQGRTELTKGGHYYKKNITKEIFVFNGKLVNFFSDLTLK